MACARCVVCGLDLPWDKEFCPVRYCGRETMPEDSWDHDPEWAYKVKSMNLIPQEGEEIPNVTAKIVRKDGQLFVAASLLENAGYPYLESGSIVRVNTKFYEVMGAVYPNSDTPGWWISLVDVDEWLGKIPVLDPVTYSDMMVDRGF